jgi:hypothetical protein
MDREIRYIQNYKYAGELFFDRNVINMLCSTYYTGKCFLHATGTLWLHWQYLVLHQPPHYFLLHTVSLV